MVEYQPTSRRPIAAIFRSMSRFVVDFCIRAQIHPDAISYASIIASALCAGCFWQAGAHPVLLIVAPLLAYLRLWFNMLDGMVALAAKKASPRGEIVNELPDRISDVLIFVGVAHSGLCSPPAGYWAAIAALLTAYVGTLGQAVAGRREFGGIMSKPLRMVVLHAGAWIAAGLIWFGAGDVRPAGLTALDCTCMVVIAGCVQTCWVRLARTLAVLRNRAADSGD